MRAILIDPVAKTVCEVEHDGDYKQIYTLLSDPAHDIKVDTFDAVGIGDGDSIFVDDNALLGTPRYFFKWEGYAQPLAGRGLILGCDEDGETIATKRAVVEVAAKVKFVALRVDDFRPINTTVDHPVLGPNTPVFGHQPVFSTRNQAMMDKIASGEAIDISKRPREGKYVVLDQFIEDKDYCDAEREYWVWSIGRRHSDGKILASFGSDLYQNPDYECLWLR